MLAIFLPDFLHFFQLLAPLLLLPLLLDLCILSQQLLLIFVLLFLIFIRIVARPLILFFFVVIIEVLVRILQEWRLNLHFLRLFLFKVDLQPLVNSALLLYLLPFLIFYAGRFTPSFALPLEQLSLEIDLALLLHAPLAVLPSLEDFVTWHVLCRVGTRWLHQDVSTLL